MRYDNLRAFEKHLEGAAPHHLSSLYFVIGKEEGDVQEAVDLLFRYLFPSGKGKELSLSSFDGGEVQAGELENALYSPSFFSSSSVVWIRQAEKLKKPLQEIIQNYWTRPHPSLIFVMTASNWAKNTLFYKGAEKAGIIVDFVELKPWEKEKRLIEWVNKQAAVARKIISYPASELLIKRVGHEDAALVHQEWEKILCFIGDKKEITVSDIQAICAYSHADSVWQLGEAIFRRDGGAAMRTAHALLAEGQPLLPLLRQIRNQFQTEYQISLMLAQGKQSGDIAQEFPYMKGQILTRHIQQAQHYGAENLRKGLLAIDDAELRSKSFALDETILLELLITRLTESKHT